MVLTSGVFGAISGTATAAVASIGTIMFDPLEEQGYPRGYSARCWASRPARHPDPALGPRAASAEPRVRHRT
jgi:hypothetical protein